MSSDDEIYEVEAIIGKRTVKGKTQYKVRWYGYTEKDNTWEDANNLNCSELIEDFETNGAKPPFIVKEVIYADRNKEEDEIYYKVINNNGDIKEYPSHILRIAYQQKIIEFLQGQADCEEREPAKKAKFEYVDDNENDNKKAEGLRRSKKGETKKKAGKKGKTAKAQSKEKEEESTESEHADQKTEIEKPEKKDLKPVNEEPKLKREDSEPERDSEKEKKQKTKKTKKKQDTSK